MTKQFKYFTALMLIACGCFWAIKAHASVCFLPTGDCGDSEVQIEVDPGELASKCAAAGYSLTASQCRAEGKKIGGFCPYDNKYVLCCGAEYTDRCDNTNIIVDRCGTLQKCGCAEEFNYFEDGDNCLKYNPRGTVYSNSRGDYDSGICYLKEGTGKTSTTTALYKACLCNLTAYPRSETYCASKNMTGGGSVCVDSKGDEHYSKCVCPSNFGTLKTSCSYGVENDAPTCTDEDGFTYVQSCCTCDPNVYPYENLADVQRVALTYSKCPSTCSGGWLQRYKADTCKAGYTKSGGECVPQGCTDAIKAYLKENPAKASQYGILTSSGVVDGNGNPSEARTAIVGDDITITTASTNGSYSNTTTYCTRRQCKNSSNNMRTEYTDAPDCFCTNCGVWQYNPNYGFGGGYYDPGWNNSDGWNFTWLGTVECEKLMDRSSNERYGCNKDGYGSSAQEMTAVCVETRDETQTYNTESKGLANSRALTYISGKDFAAGETGLAASSVQQSCSATPTIRYTAAQFPATNDKESSSALTFNGVNLNFSSTTTITRNVTINDGSLNANDLNVDRPLYINGGDVTGSTLSANSNVTLNANGKRPSYSVKTSYFKKRLDAYGYDFIDFNDLYFVTPRTGLAQSSNGTSAAEFSAINLRDGGQIKAARSTRSYGIHIMPESDNKAVKSYRHLTISGPSSGSATVDSNLYVGDKGGSTPTTMAQRIMLVNNVTLELKNGYEIGLSPHSEVTANTPAAIKISSVKAWKRCYTLDYMPEPDRKKDALICTGSCHNRWVSRTLGEYCTGNGAYAYFMTSIKATGEKGISYHQGCKLHNTRCNCSIPGSPTVVNGQLCNVENCLDLIFCEEQ